MSEVVLIGVALLTAGPAPLTAVQILYSNIVEEGFMSMAFAFDKGEKMPCANARRMYMQTAYFSRHAPVHVLLDQHTEPT